MSVIVDAVVHGVVCKKKLFLGLIAEIDVEIEEWGGRQIAIAAGHHFPLHLFCRALKGATISVLLPDSADGVHRRPMVMPLVNQPGSVMGTAWNFFEEAETREMDGVPWAHEISRARRSRLEALFQQDSEAEPPEADGPD